MTAAHGTLMAPKRASFSRWLRYRGRKLSRAFKGLAPKGLYARALLIIIVPVVLLQSFLVYLFMEWHWQAVTYRLSAATTHDIAMLIDVLENQPQFDPALLSDMARRNLNLVVQVQRGGTLPTRRKPRFYELLDTSLSKQLRNVIQRPFWIDSLGASRTVEIRIQLEGKILKVLVPIAQTYASNSHIFLIWMIASSLTLLAIAILFLRNQIKPILSLADAADRFGRGRPPPDDFRIRGAREVRQAAQAFLDMRERIERHVEQRTTMLAGVSHDLRTILTRFKLQLALLPPEDADALRHDADDMQQMLEDYLAFARGDSGEEIARVNIRPILEAVRATAEHTGKTVHVEIRDEPLIVPLKRAAFKRAVLNLVMNSTRFAGAITVRAMKIRQALVLTVDDDGPGIPADKRDEVFRPFHSLDGSRNQNVKSTGLGLAIARDIVRGHGGELTLEESTMGGLRAQIRIPL